MESNAHKRPSVPQGAFGMTSRVFFYTSFALSVFDFATIGMIGLGVGFGLGKRDLVIDLAAMLVICMFFVGALGLWRARFRSFASWVMGVVAAFGAVLFFVLVSTGSYLWGIYGPVGRGGGIAMFLLAMTALAYLVVLPIFQYAWLRQLQRGLDGVVKPG